MSRYLKPATALSYRAVSIAGIFVLFLPLLSLSASAQEDEAELAFAQCRGCHQVGPDAKNQFGPVLNGVMNRAAGRADSYVYSEAFTNKAADPGLFWDDATMDEFLLAPMQYITGTKMAFPGVTNDNKRSLLIEYLKRFDVDGNDITARVEEEVEPRVEQRKFAAEFSVPEHGVLHLGRIALSEEVAAWDIDVRPDGAGLPAGSGGATAGGELYDAYCASCHGDFGEGMGRWPILAGGHNTLTDDRPEKTIGSYWPYLSTVYDYIRRAMPFGNARSLSDDEVYAITAYILYLNDVVDNEAFVLSSDNFASIKLPNEENFVADNREHEAVRQLSEHEICMTDCYPEPARVIQRAMVLDVTPE